jgi:hypothetical protein
LLDDQIVDKNQQLGRLEYSVRNPGREVINSLQATRLRGFDHFSESCPTTYPQDLWVSLTSLHVDPQRRKSTDK